MYLQEGAVVDEWVAAKQRLKVEVADWIVPLMCHKHVGIIAQEEHAAVPELGQRREKEIMGGAV